MISGQLTLTTRPGNSIPGNATATKTMSGNNYTTWGMRLQVNNSHEPCPNMDAKGLKVFEEVVETQADKHD